ncbi:hypothetical protein [Staphylococcus haemolyticus]|uniref:hypothetical protein n=1 Tax=Staphylococcus haemolyticus TaxID=1283 RepID=UPI0015D88FBA|nr:hypothetical protein [Staphylococcus haemolyticus]MDT3947671.1 hypothetical protein [Staphylococcus haemolyticus]
MKKKIIGSIAGALLISSSATFLPQSQQQHIPHFQKEAQAKKKAITTRTLTKKETKEMSQRMRQISGSKGATILETIIGLTGIGTPAALASSLARSSQDKEIFHKARYQNKRVKIYVYQGPTPNLYEYKYKIV